MGSTRPRRHLLVILIIAVKIPNHPLSTFGVSSVSHVTGQFIGPPPPRACVSLNFDRTGNSAVIGRITFPLSGLVNPLTPTSRPSRLLQVEGESAPFVLRLHPRESSLLIKSLLKYTTTTTNNNHVGVLRGATSSPRSCLQAIAGFQ